MHFIAHLSWTVSFLIFYYVVISLERYMERRVYGKFFCMLQFFVVLLSYNIHCLWFLKIKTKSFVVQIFYFSIHGIFPCGETLMDFIDFDFFCYLFLQCNQKYKYFSLCDNFFYKFWDFFFVVANDEVMLGLNFNFILLLLQLWL